MAYPKKTDIFHFVKVDDTHIKYIEKQMVKNDNDVKRKSKTKSKLIPIADIAIDPNDKKFADILSKLDDVLNFDANRNPIKYLDEILINGETFLDLTQELDLYTKPFLQDVFAMSYNDPETYEKCFYYQYIKRSELNKLSILERLQLQNYTDSFIERIEGLEINERFYIEWNYYK